jgi:hypothetical protein
MVGRLKKRSLRPSDRTHAVFFISGICSEHRGFHRGDGVVVALALIRGLSFFNVFVLACFLIGSGQSAIAKEQTDSSRLSLQLDSQWISRPEERSGRPTGLFQETRLRLVSDLLRGAAMEDASIKYTVSLDIGTYWLTEWPRVAGRADLAAAGNIASPYISPRIRVSGSLMGGFVSGSLFFEGRHREYVGDSKQVPSKFKGWDPRTGVAFGFWRELNRTPYIYFDSYGDVVHVPMFASSPTATLMPRLGWRLAEHLFGEHAFLVSLEAEFFWQDAASIDLGTRRAEGRVGFVSSFIGKGGYSAQLRLLEGWPLAREHDPRSRFEGVFVLAATW